MELNIKISDIDYAALITELLPRMQDRQQSVDGITGKILSRLSSLPPEFVKNMVQSLPQETKDELAILLINKNKERLAEKLTKFSASMGIPMTIDDVEMRK